MNPASTFAERLQQLASTWLARAETWLPNLLGALALLLAGSLLGWLAAALTRRLFAALDLTLTRVFGAARGERLQLPRHAGWVARAVFWVVWLLFAAAALQTLGASALAPWLAPLVDHLPALLAGVLIIGAGVLLARVVGDVVAGSAVAMPAAQRQVLARTAQAVVLTAAILVGADQMGLRLTFVAILAGALALALAGGAIVAVSLGARQHVANLIGMLQVRSRLQPGMRIRIAGHEGRVLQCLADVLLIETPDGRAALPGQLFSREPLVELGERSDG